MSLTALLALVCIVLAFVGAAVDEKLLLGTVEWLLASLAFSLLDVDVHLGRK